MIKIQIILLFITMGQLNSDRRQKILDIVRDEYCEIFSTDKESVKVNLCDGRGNMEEKFDLVLNISSTKRVINEGSLQDKFRKSVSAKLVNIFPKWIGFTGKVGVRNGELLLPTENQLKSEDRNGDDEQNRSQNYIAEESTVDFERLQLSQSTIDEIDTAIKRIELEREVFGEWGLYAIMPNPICALNFYGEPGTGKSLAADAVANRLNKKIIHASYADIESKYHGEGPKNVQAIFKAAQEQDAILFIDEADSLLSKRLTNVTQGSEQAINSMRSQILICLEKFHGIVIFASNLIVNYDRAFASRLISVKFELPNAKMRENIWKVHLLPTPNAKIQLKIPLAKDVNIKALSEKYEVCGRDIRNAVVNACVNARDKNMTELTNDIIIAAIEREIQRKNEIATAKDHTELNKVIERKIADS